MDEEVGWIESLPGLSQRCQNCRNWILLYSRKINGPADATWACVIERSDRRQERKVGRKMQRSESFFGSAGSQPASQPDVSPRKEKRIGGRRKKRIKVDDGVGGNSPPPLPSLPPSVRRPAVLSFDRWQVHTARQSQGSMDRNSIAPERSVGRSDGWPDGVSPISVWTRKIVRTCSLSSL